MFYLITKDLGGGEPLIIGATEALAEFLMLTLFADDAPDQQDDITQLERDRRRLQLEIEIESAKQELAELRKEAADD